MRVNKSWFWKIIEELSVWAHCFVIRHSDIECTLRGKNSVEAVIVATVAIVVVQAEQPSIRPTVRTAATKEPTRVRIRKVGVITAPGLIVA